VPPATTVGPRMATPDEPLRCAVLISGSGSGMEALVKAQRTQHLPHTTVLVLSNRADAHGLERARSLDVPTAVVERMDESGQGRTREEHETLVLKQLELHEIEFVVLAGYMRLLSPHFLNRWQHRVVNIHPSLLPHFPGAHAHRDVLAAGTTISGCTVHLVDEGMDTGAILGQCSVPVFSHDDEGSLSARVKIEEHRLYPTVLSWIAEGRVHLVNGKARVDGEPPLTVC